MSPENGKSLLEFRKRDRRTFAFRPDCAGALYASDDEDDDEQFQQQAKAPSGTWTRWLR